jgi:hypothetical protein
MKNKLPYYLLLATLLFALSSCAKKKAPIDPSVIHDKLQDIDFEYFSTTLKADYQDDSSKVQLNIFVRMKKDSVVWANVIYPPAIKVARANILLDSLHVIKYFKGNAYYPRSFDQYQKEVHPAISYRLIQSLVLGDKPVLKAPQEKIIQKDSGYTIVQKDRLGKIEYDVDTAIMKIREIRLFKKESEKMLCHIKFDDFRNVQNRVLYHKANIDLRIPNAQGDTIHGNLKIEQSNPAFSQDPMRFSFKVRDSYEVRD